MKRAADELLLVRFEWKQLGVKFVNVGKLHRCALGKMELTDFGPMPRLLEHSPASHSTSRSFPTHRLAQRG
jgi:hypothetical protein